MERKKILFINGGLDCGGAEQALYDLMCLLDKDKFDISLLVFYANGLWEEKFREAGFEVMTPWGCQKSSRNPFRKLLNKIIGVPIVYAMTHNGRHLVPACTFQKFDLIVSYSVWEMQECAFAGKAKTVKVVHGNLETNPKYHENYLKNLETLKKFDRLICVSKGVEGAFRRVTGIQEGVKTIYNPFNSDRIHEMAQEEISYHTELPLLCAVGRLDAEKGFARLIRIHKQLLEEGILHSLVIVGGGEEQEPLQAVIDELQVGDTVTLAGYTPNPYPYMKQSRMLVCSSYTEGMPVVSVEALSLGIPVIASVPSVAESFGSENCGLITENDDESLKAGLRRMLTEEDFYQSLKAGAEKRSLALDGHKMVQAVEQEYLSLLQE